ncbi:V-type ATP synthase subunit D [Dehalococcoidia bacterium]|nr:V-type ATP synthase subunit D [Dehalococcoidia bacterium]MCL0082183.1 V-type ATP synthase subunit D [Dehalococcoidia bacterium]
MPQLIRVRPTKIELVRLKRRLSLAKRVQKIVKDRLSILTMEFLQVARESVAKKRSLIEEFAMAYRSQTVAAGYHGYIALEKEFAASEADVRVATGSRNIAGVRAPVFELKEGKTGASPGFSLIDTSSAVDQAAESFRKCLEVIIELAELQRNLELLGMEIKRAKRVSNALEYVVIPNLQVTIKHLNMKFEEREREEKSRLKRVKVLLQ